MQILSSQPLCITQSFVHMLDIVADKKICKVMCIKYFFLQMIYNVAFSIALMIDFNCLIKKPLN